jgi:hypothetical protein
MIYYSVTINVQYITIFRLKKALGSVAARGGEGRCFFGLSFLVLAGFGDFVRQTCRHAPPSRRTSPAKANVEHSQSGFVLREGYIYGMFLSGVLKS